MAANRVLVHRRKIVSYIRKGTIAHTTRQIYIAYKDMGVLGSELWVQSLPSDRDTGWNCKAYIPLGIFWIFPTRDISPTCTFHLRYMYISFCPNAIYLTLGISIKKN